MRTALAPTTTASAPCGPAVPALLFLGAATALALVKPELQPSHLVTRHRAVVGGRITRVDEDKGLVVFRVTHVCTGEFKPKTVTIRVPEAEGDEESLLADAREGHAVVAYVSKTRRRHERDGLLYCGRQWHDVQIADLADQSVWTWREALGDEMTGTFNGAPEQLLAMMLDVRSGRAFFPAYPTVKFRPERALGRFDGPIRGVALYDVDGDGKLDVYACHEKGGRLYLQTGKLAFEDHTARLGLAGVRGVSCSFGDVNADGRADLLVDGILYLGSEGGFRRSTLLPAGANERVKCAALVEIDGDGYPDVVLSRLERGLAVYLNPGAKGGAFRDATAASGLASPACGAGQTGFFAPGDWNGDARTDLYYAIRKGLILVQNAKGRFAPIPHRIDFDYRTSGSREPGLTGAGCFAPLWRPDRWDLVAAGDMHVTIYTNERGRPRDVTGLGNETRIARVSQLATLAEDLNMDGRVDLFTVTRAADASNVYHANRGYGSYMLSELYADYDAFPGKGYPTGAWGAAAGDADGDGATDLLLGGVDGVLRLLLSDAFGHPLRQPREHPTALQKTLRQTCVLTVKVTGPLGVVGADVRLTDEAGRVVRRHVIASQVLTGCRGPDAVCLAVRQPGTYRLTVRYADGLARTWRVALGKKQRVTRTATRR